MLLVVDHRLLGDPVDAERDLVSDAARDDLDPAVLAAQRERHRDDRLERVALPAAVRRHVRLAARRPGREVEDRGDRLGRDAGPVVAHPDLAACDSDPDHRRDAGFLAGIERVVDQLLYDDQRPVVGLVAGLCDQLFGEQNSSNRLVEKVVRWMGLTCRESAGRLFCWLSCDPVSISGVGPREEPAPSFLAHLPAWVALRPTALEPLAGPRGLEDPGSADPRMGQAIRLRDPALEGAGGLAELRRVLGDGMEFPQNGHWSVRHLIAAGQTETT